MSVDPIDKDVSNPDIPKDKRKYVRIWRLELSREFIFLMVVIVFATATALYNPIEIHKIAEQNNQINLQNLNNTNRIIDYLDISNRNDTASGMDLIKVILLYLQDNERDVGKLMTAHNISNTHFVQINGTHAITEAGVVKLPYIIDLNISNLTQQTDSQKNQTLFNVTS